MQRFIPAVLIVSFSFFILEFIGALWIVRLTHGEMESTFWSLINWSEERFDSCSDLFPWDG